MTEAFDVRHPTLPEIAGVTRVQLFEEPAGAQAPTRIAVAMPPGLTGRSPCGTGTYASQRKAG